MTKKLLLYASVLCTIVFSSCKDDEEEIQKIKEVRYGEFVMDNEYGPRMLLNLKEMKIKSKMKIHLKKLRRNLTLTSLSLILIQKASLRMKRMNTIFQKVFLINRHLIMRIIHSQNGQDIILLEPHLLI